MGGRGQVRAPHHTNVCKVLRLCGAISSLSLDVSPLNLVSYLVFKALLQQCRWIFAYCYLSKLVRIYYAASVSEKNSRTTCSQQELIYWRVIYSQNIKKCLRKASIVLQKTCCDWSKKKNSGQPTNNTAAFQHFPTLRFSRETFLLQREAMSVRYFSLLEPLCQVSSRTLSV